MSLHDYHAGQMLECHDFPFYAIIQCAMRQADSDNLAKLRQAFPEVYEDLQRRYRTLGGVLPEDGVNLDDAEDIIYAIQEHFGVKA